MSILTTKDDLVKAELRSLRLLRDAVAEFQDAKGKTEIVAAGMAMLACLRAHDAEQKELNNNITMSKS